MDTTGSKAKVLVIDDEKAVRDTIVRQLAAAGYQAAGAGGGEEGLELAKKERFDVVVCDVSMPGLGGFGALRALKRLSPPPQVVMATGFATEDQTADLMREGASGCLPKPFAIEDLFRALEEALKDK